MVSILSKAVYPISIFLGLWVQIFRFDPQLGEPTQLRTGVIRYYTWWRLPASPESSVSLRSISLHIATLGDAATPMSSFPTRFVFFGNTFRYRRLGGLPSFTVSGQHGASVILLVKVISEFEVCDHLSLWQLKFIAHILMCFGHFYRSCGVRRSAIIL